jgi:hypothetical protein
MDTTCKSNATWQITKIDKNYTQKGKRNQGRPLKRLLDVWDWNGSTSGPTPWQLRGDDGDDNDYDDDDNS